MGIDSRGIRKPELLVPAGSIEVLKTAVVYGADAVYIGGEVFSLRAKAKNFSEWEMAEGIEFAHSHGVRVHVTANIFAHNYDLDAAKRYFVKLREIGPDALIISDPGMYQICREVWPEAEIHISTQANNTNYMTYRFWWEQGAKRVVSARELSLQEIREIREKIPDEMEIESFVHGSMCISYSGRCLLSNFLTGRDANRGACTHPCRWKYTLMEETRPGEYFPIFENDRGTFIFNSRDLCMIEHIPELVNAGIDSFKIEGRMKNALYAATVARTYRKAIDDFFESEEKYRNNTDWYHAEIAKCTYRPFSTGFYFGKPDENSQIYDESTYVSEYRYLGIIEDKKKKEELLPHKDNDSEKKDIYLSEFEQKNKFCVGDEIEIMKPDGRNLKALVEELYDAQTMEAVDSCPHAKQKLWIKLSQIPDVHDILRVEAAEK